MSLLSYRYTQVSIEVSKSDVLDVLDAFSCKCRAVSSRGEVDSEEAVVKTARKSYFMFDQGNNPVLRNFSPS